VLAVVLATAAMSTGCPGRSKDNAVATTHTATVGPDGGEFRLGELTVVVPAGAVSAGTRLSATAPKTEPADHSDAALRGVRQSAVTFDVSLAGGAQPAPGKALDIAVPLKGGFLPPGAQPNHALLYTPAASGAQGWRLVPATVDDGVLHAKLGHLSPKTIAYLDDRALQDAIASGAVSVEARPDCAQSVTSRTAGKVQIGKASTGWSTNADSPIFACLFASGDDASLSIRNRVNVILSVAATGGLTLGSPQTTAEEEIAKRLADLLFPNPAIKAYLSRGAELTAVLPAASLPATVELRGDPNTFLAEAAWTALRIVVGLVVGKNSGEVAREVKMVIEAPGVVDCLRQAVTISGGEVPSLGDVAELVTSKCTRVITEVLGANVDDVAAWDRLWNRFFAVGDGIVTGWNTFWSAIDGIKMQFNGTMRVVVERPDPCPGKADFEKVAKGALFDTGALEVVKAALNSSITCAGGWAAAPRVVYTYDDGSTDTAWVVMQFSNGAWRSKGAAVVPPGAACAGNAYYAQIGAAPAAIKKAIGC
jgi:hypothetical protein